MEQTCKRNCYQSISLYLFLKINLVMLFLIASFIHFICRFSFIIILNVSEFVQCPQGCCQPNNIIILTSYTVKGILNM